MSVSHLGRLLESGEYERCLAEAVALLTECEHDVKAKARIQGAICRSSLELTDYFAAVQAGHEAVRLAQEAQTPDVLGFALVDLATALGAIRRYAEALGHFRRYFLGLPTYLAARVIEGIALRRMAQTLWAVGSDVEAQARYWEARTWFERYGDDVSYRECGRALVEIHLRNGEPDRTIALLREGDQFVLDHPDDTAALADHLLDRSEFHHAKGEHSESIQEAFHVLELGDVDVARQTRAHLVLCRNALTQDRPKEAFSFAFAARVCAIDGKLYQQEFEASDVVFRLLRAHGVSLLQDLEADYARNGVDLYHYLSTDTLRRMQQAH